ncbi:hypothetical protein DFH07DRAFT_784075 [Mycena maculata]|uniref:Uncharacterized protein n=1 Tax=Mycena maculata TaxID=230809 RepID=A0AAD7MKI7_9AGAR|nr:hypothetical protein DFH07DRAFT_784075 [Mycena maculata]
MLYATSVAIVLFRCSLILGIAVSQRDDVRNPTTVGLHAKCENVPGGKEKRKWADGASEDGPAPSAAGRDMRGADRGSSELQNTIVKDTAAQKMENWMSIQHASSSTHLIIRSSTSSYAIFPRALKRPKVWLYDLNLPSGTPRVWSFHRVTVLWRPTQYTSTCITRRPTPGLSCCAALSKAEAMLVHTEILAETLQFFYQQSGGRNYNCTHRDTAPGFNVLQVCSSTRSLPLHVASMPVYLEILFAPYTATLQFLAEFFRYQSPVLSRVQFVYRFFAFRRATIHLSPPTRDSTGSSNGNSEVLQILIRTRDSARRVIFAALKVFPPYLAALRANLHSEAQFLFQ